VAAAGQSHMGKVAYPDFSGPIIAREAQSVSSDATSSKSRLVFIDNLRAVVIVLVMMVHLSIHLRRRGGWYYKETKADTFTGLVLTPQYHQSVLLHGLPVPDLRLLHAGVVRSQGAPPIPHRPPRAIGHPAADLHRVMYPFIVYWLGRHGLVNHTGSFWTGSAGITPRSRLAKVRCGSSKRYSFSALSTRHGGWRAGRQPRRRTATGNSRVLCRWLCCGIPGDYHISCAAAMAYRLVFRPLEFSVSLLPAVYRHVRPGHYRSPPPVADADAENDGQVGAPPRRGVRICLLPVLMLLGGAAKGDISRYVGGLHWQALAWSCGSRDWACC